MRRMMADRATLHTVIGQSPFEMLFGRKMKIGTISPEDQQHQLRNNKDNMRESLIRKRRNQRKFLM